MTTMQSDSALVIFDGVCNLCNGSVRFIQARDRTGRIRFMSRQSPEAAPYLDALEPAHRALESIVLLEGGRSWVKSTAALRITRYLRWPWPALYALVLVPRRVRDRGYDFVAHHRYRWFGRTDGACAVPPRERARV